LARLLNLVKLGEELGDHLLGKLYAELMVLGNQVLCTLAQMLLQLRYEFVCYLLI
jgi:hypothetical protein